MTTVCRHYGGTRTEPDEIRELLTWLVVATQGARLPLLRFLNQRQWVECE